MITANATSSLSPSPQEALYTDSVQVAKADPEVKHEVQKLLTRSRETRPDEEPGIFMPRAQRLLQPPSLQAIVEIAIEEAAQDPGPRRQRLMEVVCQSLSYYAAKPVTATLLHLLQSPQFESERLELLVRCLPRQSLSPAVLDVVPTWSAKTAPATAHRCETVLAQRIASLSNSGNDHVDQKLAMVARLSALEAAEAWSFLTARRRMGTINTELPAPLSSTADDFSRGSAARHVDLCCRALAATGMLHTEPPPDAPAHRLIYDAHDALAQARARSIADVERQDRFDTLFERAASLRPPPVALLAFQTLAELALTLPPKHRATCLAEIGQALRAIAQECGKSPEWLADIGASACAVIRQARRLTADDVAPADRASVINGRVNMVIEPLLHLMSDEAQRAKNSDFEGELAARLMDALKASDSSDSGTSCAAEQELRGFAPLFSTYLPDAERLDSARHQVSDATLTVLQRRSAAEHIALRQPGLNPPP